MNKDKKIIKNLFLKACDVERVAASRIVACIVYRGKIIAYGQNMKRSHGLQLRFKKNKHAIHIHAEIDAIKNTLRIITIKELKNCKLYVARAKIVNNDFSYGLAKPCRGCERAIITFNIKKVIYSIENNEIEYLNL